MKEVVLEGKTIKIKNENMFILGLSKEEIKEVRESLSFTEEHAMIGEEGDIPVSNVFLVSVGEE